MNYTVITDIFGNKILPDNNNIIPFLLINTTQPYLLFEKVSELSENDNILKIKLPYLYQILNANNINSSDYSSLGDIWISTKNIPSELSVILVNNDNKISSYPIDFIKIDNYYNINIWKPVNPKGYQEIGLIASPNKPSLRSMRVINNNFIIEINNESIVKGRNTNMNEFNLLSNIGINKFTINRSKFINYLNNVKISSRQNNNLILKNNEDEKINYSVKGELKLNNKCIGVSTEDNLDDNFVYLQTCNNEINQKWYPFEDNFMSQFNHNCLTNDNGIIKNKKCINNDNSQKWNIEDVEQEINNEKNLWKSTKGKLVMLIESNNPWYDNKKKLYSENIMNQTLEQLNNDNNNNHTENYNYEYNVLRNKNKPKKKLYEKTNKNPFDFNLIACSLLLLILILVIIRYCINQNINF